MSFNIIDEEVFPVVYTDGTKANLGLKAIVSNLEKIAKIAGKNPMQELLVVRFLIAILYRSERGPISKKDWIDLWANGFSVQKAQDYLEQHRSKFDLFDPVTPFYQILDAQYEQAKTNPSNLAFIIDMQKVDHPASGPKFLYSNATEKGLANIHPADAVLHLLELQNYSVASKRSVLQGDPRRKKRGYAQQGWLGNFSALMILGTNLQETLLLNMPPYEFMELKWETDLPLWEREAQTVAPEGVSGPLDESRVPTGPCDLYTSQSSRVTLHGDRNGVTNAVVGIGDRFFKYDRHKYEPMASWVFAKREKDPPAYTPAKVNEGIAWRGMESLLARESKKDRILAKNLDFYKTVKRLTRDKLGSFVNISVVTVHYGSQDAIITDSSIDRLSLPQEAFDQDNFMVLDAIIASAKLAKEAASAVQGFQVDILVSEGKERNPKKGVKPYALARHQSDAFLAEAEEAFHEWIEDLSSQNLLLKITNWKDLLSKKAYSFVNEITDNASPNAIRGTEEEVKSVKKPINIFIAHRNFAKKLSTILK